MIGVIGVIVVIGVIGFNRGYRVYAGLGFGLNCRGLKGVIGAATVHGCRRELMSMMQTRPKP